VDGPTFSNRAFSKSAFPKGDLPARYISRRGAFALGATAVAMLSGCEEDNGYGNADAFEFDDSPKWATEDFGEVFDGNFFQLSLARCPASSGGSPDVKLGDVAPGKSLVMVVTRGSPAGGSICVYCTSQTSRLIANYKKLSQRNAEAVVVFPISTADETSQGQAFKDKVFAKLKDPPDKVPFPIVFDVELKLVDALGIRAWLSKPATYIFDPAGQIRFAYVGKNITDRPSVEAILKKLDEIGAEATKTAGTPRRGREKGPISS
jgi:peroxiredoxin